MKDLLDRAAEAVNRPEFIAEDPVQFPRRFSDLRDIEIAALLCSTIAWGRRPMICRDCRRLLDLMGNEPHHYLMQGDWESLDGDQNLHRTFFVRDLQYYLRGLRAVYGRYGTLQEFGRHAGMAGADLPAWTLAEALSKVLSEANEGPTDDRCLPVNINHSALKRLNMALRWLVRCDGIVDMGVWDIITPARLFIPMDVHVGRVSRRLGLLERKSTDRRAAVMLTDTLRSYDPLDPVKYDFALFGLGISGMPADTISAQ